MAWVLQCILEETAPDAEGENVRWALWMRKQEHIAIAFE